MTKEIGNKKTLKKARGYWWSWIVEAKQF